MNFCSDNVTGAHPAVLDAIARHNAGSVTAYGDDILTQAVEERLRALFEAPDAAVFLVATGTAANALSLSVLTPPYGAVYCYEEAHVQTDECGAPEFFTGGAKLITLPGDDGRIAPQRLEAEVARPTHGVHHVKPAAVTLTQATCVGTVYTVDQVHALSTIAHDHGLRTHMDGARFANALATLGCTPAEATWKAGVDVLSFGATKNGALAAEAVILFDPALAEAFAFRRKRAGHLFSKMRFLAAQMEGYLSADTWKTNAAHANAMATKLATGLKGIAGFSLLHPVEANEVFVEMSEPAMLGLHAAGFDFYRWTVPDRCVARLVTAFDTRAEDVDRFVETAVALAATA